MIYVLQVLSGKEMIVSAELKRLYCRPMVPRQVYPERRGGKIEDRINILFPGYVFVDIALNLQAYYKIRAIQYVIRFLGGGQPTALTGTEAEYINVLANGGKPLPPIAFNADGTVKKEFSPLIRGNDVSLNKRQRRAKATVRLMGEPHEVTFAVDTDEPGEPGKTQAFTADTDEPGEPGETQDLRS